MMKTLLLLVVSVLSVNAGIQNLGTCIGRCGEDGGACSCGSRCESSSNIGCCDNYGSVCHLLDTLTPRSVISISRPESCSNPGSIANGFISSNLFFISVGYSVSYSCRDGYKLDGVCNQVCTASFDLVSKPHWVPAQKPECQRIDPCENHLCHKFATCMPNHNGVGYTCKCKRSYFGNGFVCKKPCDDHNCHAMATCYGSGDGSYTCECNTGYEGSGKMCKEMYPCDSNPCDVNAKCTNVDMVRYKCDCIAGYTGNGKFCKKIDPCENHLCHRFATCMLNHNGVGYTCKCNCGYFGDGFVCKKPCDDHKCHPMATCYGLLDGNYICQCNKGYEGSGKMCKQPCDDHKCHPMATCYGLLNGNYICQCNKGYEGSGKMCKPINPCNFADCHEHSSCHVVDGHPVCKCVLGYSLGIGGKCNRRCQVPEFIDNGKFRPFQRTYPVGSTVTYRCDDGYKLKGSRIRRCQANGKFSGFSRCDPKPTIAPSLPPDSCKDKCGVYSFGTTCTCDRDCRANRDCCHDYEKYCNDYVAMG